jgi:hypothetical protein
LGTHIQSLLINALEKILCPQANILAILQQGLQKSSSNGHNFPKNKTSFG